MENHVKSQRHIPFNSRVAMELIKALAEECSKPHWRDALRRAEQRWLAEDNKVERLPYRAFGKRGGSGYVE